MNEKKFTSKDMNLDKEQQISLLILLATFKSLNEQLYNLKGAHSGIVKKRFNMLQNAFRSYERVIDKSWLKQNKDILEKLNDALTDIIYMLRDGIEQKEEGENDN
tara:strand:+ start:77 stop:391 length:315 start_codon:yes stop_codon:yes gene_type:complete